MRNRGPMRESSSRSLFAALVLLLVISAHGVEPGGEFDSEGWTWRWPVEVKREDAAFARIAVTPEMADAARRDLSDLRIVDSKGQLTPYAYERQPEPATERYVAGQLFNRTYETGEYERTEVDFRRAIPKTHIRVETTGADFRRRAHLEGSRDGESWSTLTDDALLFHIARPEGDFVADTIRFPRNTFRYLRLTIHAMEEETGRFDIQAVRTTEYAPVAPPERITVEPAEHTRTIDREAAQTLVDLDLGYRNLPVDRIAFDVDDAYFHRPVTLYGRNVEQERIRRRTETGWDETTREAPWRRLYRGVLHRIQEADGVTRESTSIEGVRAPYRYLRVVIHDGDDAPLRLDGVTVLRRKLPRLVFEYAANEAYWLYAGNANARAPRFDLEQAARPVLEQEWPMAALGTAQRLVPEEPVAPWTDRYHALIWIVLIVAVGVLGFAVYQALDNLAKNETPES